MSNPDDAALAPAPAARGRESLLFHGLLVVVAVLHAIFFLSTSIRPLLAKLPDDTLYYLQIARSVARGSGPTFDGMTPTNGYQPLWMLLIVPVHAVVRSSPEAAFRAAMLLNVALCSAAVALVHRTLASLVSPRVALLAGTVFLFEAFRWATNGMETGALVLAVALLAHHGVRVRITTTTRPRDALVFGVLLGLVVLARLDSEFFAAIVLAALLAVALVGPGPRRAGLARLAWVVAGAALVVGPYLLYNRVAFGDITPISGRIKSTFPYPHLNHAVRRLAQFSAVAHVQLGIAVAYLGWFAFWPGARRSPDARARYVRGAAALLAAGVAAHYVQEMLFMKRFGVMAWHFALGLALPAAVVAALGSMARGRARSRLASVAYALALGAVGLVGGLAVQRRLTTEGDTGGAPWHGIAYDAAHWVQAHTPPGAVLAMKDAGNMGYFSGHPVVNLDGVVNDMRLQDAIRSKRFHEYLRERGVKYLVQHSMGFDDPFLPWMVESGDPAAVLLGGYEAINIRYVANYYNTISEPVRVEAAREVYRSPMYDDNGITTRLFIWSIDP